MVEDEEHGCETRVVEFQRYLGEVTDLRLDRGFEDGARGLRNHLSEFSNLIIPREVGTHSLGVLVRRTSGITVLPVVER